MPSMTRWHFDLTAEIIRDGREHYQSNTEHAKHAAEIAARFRHTNVAFDSARFIMACMPREWVGTSKANVWERMARNV